MNDLCCMTGCNSLGTKSCGACGMASYCSSECQKEDWKVHKNMCINATKLPTKFLSTSELSKYLTKISALLNYLRPQGQNKVAMAMTLLKKCLAFVEHQCGVQVEGKPCWRRSDGDLVSNIPLVNIRVEMAGLYTAIGDNDSVFAYANEARQMLESGDRSDDDTLISLTRTESMISGSYLERELLDLAAEHNEQSLMFSRLIKGESSFHYEFKGLQNHASILQRQHRILEAISVSEQAYILVSGLHRPVHPEVQNAASRLIHNLISNGDFDRADDYCRMNYENLTDTRDSINHDDDHVASARLQLASIWLGKTPVDDEEAALALAEEAEDMARKSCSVPYGFNVVMAHRYEVLANVLMRRGKYTDEVEMLLDHAYRLYRGEKPRLHGEEFITCLNSLQQYHNYMSDTIPDGDEKDRVLELILAYQQEIFMLQNPDQFHNLLSRYAEEENEVEDNEIEENEVEKRI